MLWLEENSTKSLSWQKQGHIAQFKLIENVMYFDNATKQSKKELIDLLICCMKTGEKSYSTVQADMCQLL